jgi:hypothetical protein
MPPRRPGEFLGAAIAWLVIFLLVGFLVYRTVRPTPEEKGEDAKLGNIVWEMQARYLVGFSHLWKDLKGGPADIYQQALAFNRGGPKQRLQFVVLAGELAGPGEALRLLRDLDQLPHEDFQPTPAQRQVRDILGRLYRDYAHLRLDAPSVSKAERALLIEQLGWFGDLALAPLARSLKPASAASA